MAAPVITNPLQRSWWVSNKLHMEFVFFVAKVSHWARVYCYNRTSRTQRVLLLRQGGTFLQNPCFIENVVRYSRPVGRRWMPQRCWGTLGDCPGSQLFLSFLTIFRSHLLALPAYSVNNISFLSLWGSWRQDIHSFPCLPDTEITLWYKVN